MRRDETKHRAIAISSYHMARESEFRSKVSTIMILVHIFAIVDTLGGVDNRGGRFDHMHSLSFEPLSFVAYAKKNGDQPA